MRLALSIDEAQGLLMEAGFRKPLTLLKLSDKSIVRGVLLDYHLMVKVKLHMDQFAEGLNQLKLLDLIQAHPTLFKDLFVYNETKITAGNSITIVNMRNYIYNFISLQRSLNGYFL